MGGFVGATGLGLGGWSDSPGGAPVLDDGSTITGWEKVLDDLIQQGSKIAQIVVGPPAPVGGVGVRPPAPVQGAGQGGALQPGPVGNLPPFSQMGVLFLLIAIFIAILAFGMGKKKAA